MCELQVIKPYVISKVSAVPTYTDKQILIIDVRNANMVFTNQPKVDLLSHGRLVELYLQPKQTLYVEKFDVNNYYYSLQMPAWISEFSGLPSIEMNGDQLWPVVRTHSMSWYHFVYVGQQLHEEILYRVGLPKTK